MVGPTMNLISRTSKKMWEEGVRIYGIPRVHNNFPLTEYMDVHHPHPHPQKKKKKKKKKKSIYYTFNLMILN